MASKCWSFEGKEADLLKIVWKLTYDCESYRLCVLHDGRIIGGCAMRHPSRWYDPQRVFDKHSATDSGTIRKLEFPKDAKQVMERSTDHKKREEADLVLEKLKKQLVQHTVFLESEKKLLQTDKSSSEDEVEILDKRPKYSQVLASSDSSTYENDDTTSVEDESPQGEEVAVIHEDGSVWVNHTSKRLEKEHISQQEGNYLRNELQKLGWVWRGDREPICEIYEDGSSSNAKDWTVVMPILDKMVCEWKATQAALAKREEERLENERLEVEKRLLQEKQALEKRIQIRNAWKVKTQLKSSRIKKRAKEKLLKKVIQKITL